MQSSLQLHKSFKNHGVYCLSLLQDLPACLKCRTSNMFLLQTCKALYWPISSVAKPTLSVRDVWGSISGPIESSESRERIATVATFVRSYMVQTLSRWHSPLSHHQACGFAKLVVISTCLLYFIHALCNCVSGQIQHCLVVP